MRKRHTFTRSIILPRDIKILDAFQEPITVREVVREKHFGCTTQNLRYTLERLLELDLLEEKKVLNASGKRRIRLLVTTKRGLGLIELFSECLEE